MPDLIRHPVGAQLMPSTDRFDVSDMSDVVLIAFSTL